MKLSDPRNTVYDKDFVKFHYKDSRVNKYIDYDKYMELEIEEHFCFSRVIELLDRRFKENDYLRSWTGEQEEELIILCEKFNIDNDFCKIADPEKEGNKEMYRYRK